MEDLISVFRPKRWYQNGVFILGTALALIILRLDLNLYLFNIIKGFLGFCFLSSSNYGINELTDYKSDSHHPYKKNRALPMGKISPNLVLAVSFIFLTVGLYLVLSAGNWLYHFSITLFLLNAYLYNLPPFRTKNLPYLDYLMEALNNPLRFMAGWYCVANSNQLVPATYLLGFWFLGIFLMSAKRFGEIRLFSRQKKGTLELYRRSLKFYTEKSLLFVMIASISSFYYMFGAMSMKHNIDLLIILPFLVIWTVWFFNLAYEKNTIVKDPDRIFERKKFMFYSLFVLSLYLFLVVTRLHLMDFFKTEYK